MKILFISKVKILVLVKQLNSRANKFYHELILVLKGVGS